MRFKNDKVEISLVSAELTGLPERKLPLSRNLGSIDLVWALTRPTLGTACGKVTLAIKG